MGMFGSNCIFLAYSYFHSLNVFHGFCPIAPRTVKTPKVLAILSASVKDNSN